MGEAVKFKSGFRELESRFPEAEHAMALRIMEDTRPYVPARTLRLDRSTSVVGSKIVYSTDYASRVYNGIASNGSPIRRFSTAVHEKAGANWIERSVNDNKDTWAQILGQELSRNGR